jgi:hypothetical protein
MLNISQFILRFYVFTLPLQRIGIRLTDSQNRQTGHAKRHSRHAGA